MLIWLRYFVCKGNKVDLDSRYGLFLFTSCVQLSSIIWGLLEMLFSPKYYPIIYVYGHLCIKISVENSVSSPCYIVLQLQTHSVLYSLLFSEILVKAFSNHRLMLIDLSLNYLSLCHQRPREAWRHYIFLRKKELKICNEVNKGDMAQSYDGCEDYTEYSFYPILNSLLNSLGCWMHVGSTCDPLSSHEPPLLALAWEGS